MFRLFAGQSCGKLAGVLCDFSDPLNKGLENAGESRSIFRKKIVTQKSHSCQLRSADMPL